MRLRRLTVVAAALVICVGAVCTTVGASAAVAAQVHKRQAAKWIPGRLLVEFKDGVGAGAALRLARGAGAGGELVKAGSTAAGDDRTVILVRSKSLDVAALRRLYARDPLVLRTSPDYVREAFGMVDDPGLSAQWGLLQVGTLDAWQTTTGSRDVVVADVDTGLSLGHPEFADSLWRNADEIPGNHVDDDNNGYVDDAYGWDATQNDGEPMDFHGHGTHTAGIIAAAAGNGVGVAGVAPGVSILPVEALAENGHADDAEILNAIDYVVRAKTEGGVNVVAINASWGGGGDNALLREAIKEAGDAGIVFVAAAGNSHSDIDAAPVYPAAFDCPNIITVAATTQDDALAFFSNYGASCVDIGAPGVDIASTMTADGYARWKGTSMAAPFVTGAVALCASRWPEESVAERIARILETARPVSTLAGRCATGARLDIAAALRAAPASDDVTAPTTTVLGADDFWHDVRVKLTLAAVDEPGGSGVATSEWRLGSGRWRHGTLATVLPPERGRRTVTVHYRSKDRNGNMEATRSVAVKVRYGPPSDDVYPGVALPSSPVRGDVAAGSDRADVFGLHLLAGQSVELGLGASPAARILVGVFKPGTRTYRSTQPGMDGLIGIASSDGLEPGYGPLESAYHAVDSVVGAETIAWRSSRDATYPVVVWAESGGGAYALNYSVAPPGTDVVPPGFSVLGSEFERWNDFPVWLNIVPRDGASGVAAVETSQDGGLTWTVGEQATVDAVADHAGDGTHAVLIRARDNAGNLSAAKLYPIGIDTVGPSTTAWGPSKAIASGASWRLRFVIDDMSSFARDPELVVKSVASGQVVRKMRLLSSVATRSTLVFPVMSWKLPAGEYEVTVAGTTKDAAYNPWVEAVCARTLRVK